MAGGARCRSMEADCDDDHESHDATGVASLGFAKSFSGSNITFVTVPQDILI